MGFNASANIENVERFALSQQGKPATHSGRACDVQQSTGLSSAIYKSSAS